MKNKHQYFNPLLKPSMDWIIKDDEPQMRIPCEDLKLPINSEDINQIQKMVSYIEHSYYNNSEKFQIVPGVAIAANQIGWYKKCIYLHFDDHKQEHQYLLANPIILSKSNQICYLDSGEGCLSVPIHHEGYVPRSHEIKIQAYDLVKQKNILIQASGYAAIVFQHELDHLDGHFYYDRINLFDKFHSEKKWIKY